MISDHEMRLKLEQELENLKANYPRKNIISPKAKQILKKIRSLEHLLNVPNVSIKEIVDKPEPKREAPELIVCTT